MRDAFRNSKHTAHGRGHWAGALAIGVVCLSVVFHATPSAAIGALPVSLAFSADRAPLRTEAVRGSVAYLRSAYHVDDAEALRRLELQRRMPELETQLRRNFPNEFAGSWIDQDRGGILLLAMTKPSLLNRVRNLPDRAHVQIVQHRHSMLQLEGAVRRLTERVSDASQDYTIVADVVDNVVAVYRLRDQASESSAGRMLVAADTRLQELLAAEPQLAVGRQMPGAEDRIGFASANNEYVDPVGPGCAPKTCGPPMRGGMRLDIYRNTEQNDPDNADRRWGACTNGFNVYGTKNGWNYIMTAGHCTVGCNKVGNTRTYSQRSTPVGYEIGDLENGPLCGEGSRFPYDYAIQPYVVDGSGNWYGYWSHPYPKNQVVSWCWWDESTRGPCTDGTFAIVGVHSIVNIRKGWIVCATGSAGSDAYHSAYGWRPGTRCGQVTDTPGGIYTDICSRKGDSGGPLFSEIDGYGYGILSGGSTGVSGPCSSPGSEYSRYSPLDSIMAHVSRQTGNAYGLVIRTWQ